MRKREWRGRIGRGLSMEYDGKKKPVLLNLQEITWIEDE
jgi:hypothetical protein